MGKGFTSKLRCNRMTKCGGGIRRLLHFCQNPQDSHAEKMAVPKENLRAFFRECHCIMKTSFIPPIIPHEKIFKYKWHNNNQIHLALHFHKNNSGNVVFRWHLGARGVEERGEMEEKKMLVKSYATLSLRSLIFHLLQMLPNL